MSAVSNGLVLLSCLMPVSMPFKFSRIDTGCFILEVFQPDTASRADNILLNLSFKSLTTKSASLREKN